MTDDRTRRFRRWRTTSQTTDWQDLVAHDLALITRLVAQFHHRNLTIRPHDRDDVAQQTVIRLLKADATATDLKQLLALYRRAVHFSALNFLERDALKNSHESLEADDAQSPYRRDRASQWADR